MLWGRVGSPQKPAPARERLDWFRKNYSGLEDIFAHRYIASFLGVTPVTLSRARNA